MAVVSEIAPNVFRITVFVSDFNLQFNHFLVRDEEPLLYHAGMRRMFPELHEAVARLIDPKKLRWISWSHFEVDECGGLNEWLRAAPHAEPACSMVGAMVNLSDFSDRPAKGLNPGNVVETGAYRFRFHPTPHLPHGWDAGVLFEETQGILFCSDLFHQTGEREAITESEDVLTRTRDAMIDYQAGPLMDYMPYTPHTKRLLNELADFNPRTLAIMHGSCFSGDGGKLLRALDPIFQSIYGTERLPDAPKV